MAIDTAKKRASMLAFATGDLLPIPDGSIDQGDRQTFLHLYSGILASQLTELDRMMSRLLIITRD